MHRARPEEVPANNLLGAMMRVDQPTLHHRDLNLYLQSQNRRKNHSPQCISWN